MTKMLKGGLTQYPFFVRFFFFKFLLLREKVCAFSFTIFYVHIRTNQTVTVPHTGQKFYEKKIL